MPSADVVMTVSNIRIALQNDFTGEFTGKVYLMMELFMENPRILFSVQQLMDKIWGWDAEAETNVVWVNISTLRKRLTELGTNVEIRVHRGTGYSLEKKL